ALHLVLAHLLVAAEEGGHFPAQAQLCDKCHFKAKVLLDGCLTCLNCGDSKCG
ncbi:MAG TPA: hypothetical protein PKI23_06790, partial [Pseudomonadales bacterium]|nr:hypothetical protein [Pseudomonadales bacterium]